MNSPLYFNLNASYLIFFLLIPLILGGIASFIAKSQLRKYNKIANSVNFTGSEAANEMLNYHGVNGVLFSTGYNDQDFYDPRNNSITLSKDYCNSTTVSAIAVACHEAGHACQRAKSYLPYNIRTFLVPIVNLCSNAWMFILLFGIIFNITGLTNIAIAVFGVVLVFQIATLPVEFNASHRAIQYLETLDLSNEEIKGAKRVLRSCAFTYVISALIAAIQLLWILAQKRSN